MLAAVKCRAGLRHARARSLAPRTPFAFESQHERHHFRRRYLDGRRGRGAGGGHRSAPRHPCRAGARPRLPEDHRQDQGRPGRTAAGDPRRAVDQRRRGHPARTRQRANGPAARRHGRLAAPRRHGPRLYLAQSGRHARLRPRHPRRHAGRRGPRPLRAAGPSGRHGDVHVPAGRRGLARRAVHARGRLARSHARRRFRPAHFTQHAGGGVRQPRRTAAGRLRQAAHSGDRRGPTTPSIPFQCCAKSSPPCRP